MSEKTLQRPYFHLLEAYRGVAATAIVLHHLGAIAAKEYQVPFLGGLFTACHFRIDFFFVLSGFLIGWLYSHGLGDRALALPFLRNRLARIYPLLFILTTVKLGFILLMMTGRWSRDALDLSVILSSYLMLPSDRFPLILPAWTMPYEVFFYLAFTLAILIGGRLFTGLALIWSVAIVVANVMEIPVLGIWASFLLKPFHLQLLAGVGTSVLVRKFLPLKWGLPLLVAGLLMLVAGLTMHAQVEAWLPLYKRCWWALVFCVLIAGTAAYEMGRKHPVPVPRWMKALGRGSYSIYLVHSPVLVVLLAVIAPRGWLHGPAANLLLLLLAAIAIAAGLLCYHFLEIPLNRRFKTPLPKPNPPLADRSSPGSRLP